MIFKKKKKYTIGDFETDDLNDFGIAKYYQKRYEELLVDNFEKTKKITNMEYEMRNIRDELYKYECQNAELQSEIVRLKVNAGEEII